MNITPEEFLNIIRLLEWQQAVIEELSQCTYTIGRCILCRYNPATDKFCKKCSEKGYKLERNAKRLINQQDAGKLLRRHEHDKSKKIPA